MVRWERWLARSQVGSVGCGRSVQTASAGRQIDWGMGRKGTGRLTVYVQDLLGGRGLIHLGITTMRRALPCPLSSDPELCSPGYVAGLRSWPRRLRCLSGGDGGSEAKEVGKQMRTGEIVRCRGEDGSEGGRCAEGYVLTPVLSGS